MADINAIIDGCQKENVPCSKFLATFIAQSIVLSNNDEDQVTAKTIKRILELDLASLTLKIQINFFISTLTFDKKKLIKREKLTNTKREMIQKLVSSTFSTFHSSDIKKLEKYRKDIFMYVLKSSFLLEEGDNRKSVTTMEKEITAAFDSVLPLSAIKSFVFFSESEKLTQLQELPKLILGMRINNKMLGKGGAGIQDFDEICHKKSIHLLNLVDKEINENLNVCDQLKEKICCSLQKTCNDGNDNNINSIDTLVARWINEHTFWKQYLYSLQCIKMDIEKYISKLVKVRPEFHGMINDLQRLIKRRTTIPKEHIYPKLIMVASIWETLLDYYDIAASFADCINELCKHKNVINASISSQKSRSDYLKETREGKYNVENIKSTPKKQTSSANIPVRIFASTPNFMELPLSFNGYCSWTIYHKYGLLDLGNPEIGIVKYRKKYYAFSSQDALESFMKCPKKYLEYVEYLALRRCELIHLLSLQSTFPSLSLKNIIFNLLKHPNKAHTFNTTEKINIGVQSPTHFQECFIDLSHQWNEWEVRKIFLDMVTEQNQHSDSLEQTNE